MGAMSALNTTLRSVTRPLSRAMAPASFGVVHVSRTMPLPEFQEVMLVEQGVADFHNDVNAEPPVFDWPGAKACFHGAFIDTWAGDAVRDTVATVKAIASDVTSKDK